MAVKTFSPTEYLSISDWKTIAIPRKDGSDTFIYRELIRQSPLARVVPARKGEPTIFSGRVALRHLEWPEKFEARFPPAALDHPNIARAEALVNLWPEVAEQFGELLDVMDPVRIQGVSNETNYPGSNSHQPDAIIGAIWATIHNPILLAQAMVHEMAHNKLFALGLAFNQSSPLFLNSQEELYDSPIRLDIPRPLSAVFHGVYAFMHVLALDLILLEHDPENTFVMGLTQKNARRLCRGLNLVEKCARWTPEGAVFFEEFSQWGRGLIRAGLEAVAKQQKKKAGPVILIGPAGSGKSSLARGMRKGFGTPVLSSDSYCWKLWWQLPVVQNKLVEEFGSLEIVEGLVRMDERVVFQVLWKWMKEKKFSAREMDFLKLKAVQFGLLNLKEGILELGAGHCVFSSVEARNQMLKMIRQSNSRVVQVRPVGHVEETLELLMDRTSKRKGETFRKAVRHSLENPSFREFKHFVIDTGALGPDEALEQLRLLYEGNEVAALT